MEPIWEGLWQSSAGPERRILIPRAALGTRELIRETGDGCPDLTVEDIPIYETEYETSPLIDEKKEFENGEINLRRIYQRLHRERICPGRGGPGFFKSKKRCASERRPGLRAEELGMKTWMSQKATMDSVAERLEETGENGKVKKPDRRRG